MIDYTQPENKQPISGSFFESNNSTHIKDCLVNLQEGMDKEFGMHYLKNASEIFSFEKSKSLFKDLLLEDYFSQTPNVGQNIHQNNCLKLEQLVENAAKHLLSESSTNAALAPYVGMTFPMIKYAWENCVYKDVLPTEVAVSPTWRTMVEIQYLQDYEGHKYDLPEAFSNGDVNKLLGTVRKSLSDKDITVPCIGFDLITASGGSIKQQDSISKDFHIKEIVHTVKDTDGKTDKDVKLENLRIRLEPGNNDKVYQIKDANGKIIEILSLSLDYETGLLNASSTGNVKSIKVGGSLSNENNMRSATVSWRKDSHIFEIPDAIHLNTGLTEERIKDEGIIYNQDTAAKALEQMTETICHLKDLGIKDFLDKSRDRIKGTQYYELVKFDCLPPSRYSHTNLEWRKTELNETLDKLMTKIKYLLRDENCYFAIVGHPADIRLLDDIQWSYSGDQTGSGCKLNYNVGMSNKYHKLVAVSSEREEMDNMRLLLLPTTKEKMTYKHFEYQFVISNQYRNSQNNLTPNIMVFDRNLTDELLPIQANVKLENNTIAPAR